MAVELPAQGTPFVDLKNNRVNEPWYLALLNLNNSVPVNVVTSVNIAGNNGITVADSPITSAGVITLGIASLTCASAVIAGNITAASAVIAGTVNAASVIVSTAVNTVNLNASGTVTGANAVINGTITAAGVVAVNTFTAPNNSIPNAFLAQMPANTIKGNNTVTTATPLDLTTAQVAAMLSLPAQITGTWAPVDNSGAGLTFSGVSAGYTQIGNMMFAYAQLAYPATANGANASISGLPANFPAANYGRQATLTYSNGSTLGFFYILPTAGSGMFVMATAAGVIVTNAALSGATIIFQCTYPIS